MREGIEKGPFKARPMGQYTSKAWWYVDENSIDVIGRNSRDDSIGGSTHCRLTRKQLLFALKRMDALKAE